MNVAGVRSGYAVPRHWQGNKRSVDIYDVKADILEFLEVVGAPKSYKIEKSIPPWLHPGKSGSIYLGKKVLGYFGELNPKLKQILNIDFDIVVFEVFLDKLPATVFKHQFSKSELKVSSLMPIKRDFAFLIDKSVPAKNIIDSVKKKNSKLISDVKIFDVYKGEGVSSELISVGIEITIQPRESSMKDEEIEKICSEIIAEVNKSTGAILRT